MHVKKNVCDSLIDTLFNIKGKKKDDLKCCQDLVRNTLILGAEYCRKF